MENLIQELMFNHQPGMELILLVFVAGVLTSLTPCVYPMLPITLGIVGRYSQSQWQGLGLSLSFSLGIALTYASLGLLAALTGQLFGSVASHPLTQFLFGVVLLLLGLWMLGWLHLPELFTAPGLQPSPRYRYLSVLALGLLSGLVMAPCTSPVLGMLLMFVAAQGDTTWGGGLMFVFALGMCGLLVVAGSFSGLLARLPASGPWMNIVKGLMAAIILGSGLMFLGSAITAAF